MIVVSCHFSPPFPTRQQEEEAQRRREEEERLAQEERAREAKKPRHGELDLETLIGEEWDSGALSGLSSRLQAVLQERHPRRTADQDAFVFEKDKSEAAEVAALRERLQGMKIVARAKVTQDRVYSAAYHPDPTTDLIFFGGECTRPFEVSLIRDWLADGAPLKDKHGQLGIWDPRAPLDDAGEEDNVVDSGQRESGKYWRLQVHWPATSQSSISCIKFDPIDAHNVCYIPISSLLFFLTSHLPPHGRCTQVRTTLQFARSPLPPGSRARCLQWKTDSLQAWTSPPQATSCGSQMLRDGSRISICERTSRNEELISYRSRRSAL